MLKVGEVIIHRGRGEEEDGLVFHEVVKPPIAGADFSFAGLGEAAISEVVGFINNDDVRLLFHPLNLLGVVAATHEVGVVEDAEIGEALVKMRKILSPAALTWMLSSMFCVRPGSVKLLDPTSATEPTTAER